MPGPILAAAIPAIGAGFSALMGFFGNKSANKSADRSAQLQYQAAMRAADLQSRAQADQLAFLKEQEAQRRKEYEDLQLRNRQIYDDERGIEQSRYSDLQSRLTPYRNFGVGALGQMGSPIPGSLGARMGGQ